MKRKREANSVDSEEEPVDIEFDPEELDKMLDQVPEVEALDSVSMKRMLVSFERALTKNSQLRVKYPGQPDRFVESEVDLDEEIKKLQIIATAPNLYQDFINLKAHESVLSLLIHENSDITCDALDLIRELTESEVSEENPAAVTLFVDSMLKNQILELLVSNLSRLREKEADERAGVFNTLSIFENFLEVKPEIAIILGAKTDLIGWLLRRIQISVFDDVKQYSSEILSILVQNSKENQLELGKLNGIDVLLTAISKYKKLNPGTIEEEEFVENIFNTTCACVAQEQNLVYFRKADGLKLLQIVIKNKMYARKCALRLLDFVMTADPSSSRRWVDVPGLGTLFSAFMKVAKGKRKGFNETEDEEHLASIIATLFKALADEGKYYGRLLDKFKEKEFEKVERLLELYEKYNKRVNNATERIRQERQDMLDAEEEIDEDDEDAFFLQKLEAGLFTLQKVVFIIAALVRASENIRAKVTQLLIFQDSSYGRVVEVLKQYADGLGGPDANLESVEKEKSYILGLAKDVENLQSK